jgi:hypothetical protein
LPTDLPDELPLLCAEPMEIACELRLFCVDDDVVTGSGYWREDAPWQVPSADPGLEARVRALIEQIWTGSGDALPRPCAIDVALVDDELVVLEGNGA